MVAQLHFVSLKDYDFGYAAHVPLAWNPFVYCFIAAVSALPLWMTLELTFQIYSTLKIRRIVLLVPPNNDLVYLNSASWTSRICIYFVPGCNQLFSIIFATLGWVGTVSGFAMVLYSRLHLVTRNRRILGGVLAMIIANFFLLHVPTIVAQIGVVTKIRRSWISWYPAMEKIQIVGFTVQEIIISTIYVWTTRKMVRESYSSQTKHAVQMFILVQCVVIVIDVPFIVLSFANIFLIKVALCSFAYAIKLKLEFTVLNQLIGIVKNGIAPRGIHQLDEARAPDNYVHVITERRRFFMSPFQQRGLGMEERSNPQPPFQPRPSPLIDRPTTTTNK